MRQKRTGGQITFRCDQMTFEQLTTAAGLLKEDVNGVVNRLVIDGLPSLLRIAREANQRFLAASLKPDVDYLPECDEMLRRILIAGRLAGRDRMESEMELAVRKSYKQAYPTREMIVAKAHAIESVIQRLFLAERMGREAADLNAEEAKSIGRVAERIRAELANRVADWTVWLKAPPPAKEKNEKKADREKLN